MRTLWNTTIRIQGSRDFRRIHYCEPDMVPERIPVQGGGYLAKLDQHAVEADGDWLIDVTYTYVRAGT